MFCPLCGTPVPEGSTQCPKCGYNLASIGAPMVAAAPASQEQPASVAPVPTEPVPTATPVIPEQMPGAASAASGQVGGVPPTAGSAPVSYQVMASPPPPPTPPTKEPWYGKTWVIVLFILFFWPVGLVLMWKKTCSWTKVAKIIVTSVIAALLVLDIVYLVNSMKPKATTTGTTTTTATSTTSAKESTPAATSSPTSGGYDTWAAECLDANKGITVYSLCELKGWQLETLATQNGYQLTTASGGGQGLYRSSDGAILTANDTSGNLLNESTLQSLDKGANGQAVVYCLIAPYYSSLDACVKGIVKVSTADSQAFSDGSYAAVVYGPSVTEYLILVANSDQGYTVVFYNKAALAAGALSYGTTIDEAWKNMTGRAVGANH